MTTSDDNEARDAVMRRVAAEMAIDYDAVKDVPTIEGGAAGFMAEEHRQLADRADHRLPWVEAATNRDLHEEGLLPDHIEVTWGDD